MKILHTADWHIGKSLHKYSLQDELTLFFDWLIEIIDHEKIDLLLVSGDIFDLANPSIHDRSLYYQFLKRLITKPIQIVITGGNHDSVGMLNAPRELLNELNIHVIGGATEIIQDELIPIYKGDNLALIVAAVPFLRDKDLRNRETDEKYRSREEAIREGIKTHYAELAKHSNELYKGVPVIAMGHLYTIGADPTDSERDIHVGNAAAIDVKVFHDHFDYVALGHIHRPQVIGKNEYIRYSGSPIPLSFSEKKDEKSIVVLELENGKIKPPKIIPTPKNRVLLKFSGSLVDVRMKLTEYVSDGLLAALIEIEIEEEDFSTKVLSEVEDLKLEFEENPNLKILKSKTVFKNGAKDTSVLFEEGKSIEDLTALDVFEQRIANESFDENTRNELISCYRELLELVEQEES